jgi:hypothetical protein
VAAGLGLRIHGDQDSLPATRSWANIAMPWAIAAWINNSPVWHSTLALRCPDPPALPPAGLAVGRFSCLGIDEEIPVLQVLNALQHLPPLSRSFRAVRGPNPSPPLHDPDLPLPRELQRFATPSHPPTSLACCLAA